MSGVAPALPPWYALKTLRSMDDVGFRSVLEHEVYRGMAVDRPIPYTRRHLAVALDVAEYANGQPNDGRVQTCQVRFVNNRLLFSILPPAKRGSIDRPVIVTQDHLFTPRDPVTGFRFVMRLSAAEKRTLPHNSSPGLHGTVTDEITGRTYRVYGDPPGDAIVREVA